MNKFKYYFILLITTVSLFSCSKDNNSNPEIIPPRDYAKQYATELNDIEKYLKENYIEVTVDQDVTIKKIPAGVAQPSIWSYKDNASFPKLLNREVKLHNIVYKLYYLVLREGVGESPTNVDEVFTTYRGEYLGNDVVNGVTNQTSTKFEEFIYEPQRANLFGYIRGWKEVFPQFKTGNSALKDDGTVTYSDFGAGVMFIPSGLAYYNSANASIPAYSPLVFSFKLLGMQRLDHEYQNIGQVAVPIPDGIMSFQEDLDGDGYMWTKAELPDGAINPDDTDKDGIPDFLDTDDDGDGISTRKEITDPSGKLYSFNLIPGCDGKATDPARIKRHLIKCN
ncbi:FKBP-type peptidyl-prolyl cis-trans isomerase [Flavobacterium sp. GP15]|uniref:FKBP-type peptidyl-prolyl cis-trans isomerase n=1 Tax=Flavobacterium sp. GP15 TaxID=2758567 RepID=UPI00165E00EE|nr:FKBP-type peptidylprolyl isomerase [Flavobacterium sp. GP15]